MKTYLLKPKSYSSLHPGRGGISKGVKAYSKENNVGYTKIIRTGQICNNAGCDSFKFIDCKR